MDTSTELMPILPCDYFAIEYAMIYHRHSRIGYNGIYVFVELTPVV